MKAIIKKRLKAYYDLASPQALSDGKNWYQSAHDFAQALSDQYDISLLQVCGILSALSPGVQWDVNKRQTESLIKANYYNTALSDVAISTYSKQREKAEMFVIHRPVTIEQILEILGKESPKTKAFFWNIYQFYNPDFVTIDRWIMRVIGLPDERARRKLYKTIEAIIINLSIELNLLSNQLQAIVWLSIQENSDLPDFVVEG